jgi:hypothetical protein
VSEHAAHRMVICETPLAAHGADTSVQLPLPASEPVVVRGATGALHRPGSPDAAMRSCMPPPHGGAVVNGSVLTSALSAAV